MIGAFRWFWERGNQEVEPPTEERRDTLGGSGFDSYEQALIDRRDRFALRFVNFLVSSEFLEKES